MKMGSCTNTTKICLFIVSLVFWGAASALFFVGAWVYKTYADFGNLTEATLTLVPASIVLGAAVFMFLIGLLGFIAVFKESKVLLALFFCLILVVLLGEIVAGILGYFYRKDVETAVSNGLKDAMDHYNNSVKAEQMDYIQRELHCCGIHNSSDWLKYSYFANNTVPYSCCSIKNLTQCERFDGSNDIYKEGCLDVLEHKFVTNLVYIASVTIAFAVIQLCGLLSVCILICRTREVKYDRLENAQRNGLRV